VRVSVDLAHATRLINHGPVVLVSSHKEGKLALTPVAWHMPVDKDPPIIAFEISRTHFVHECIMETSDFTVNIPSVSLVESVVKCGSVSGRDSDKFKMCGLSPCVSKKISSVGVDESIAIMECVLKRDEHLLREYDMIVGEVKYAEAEKEAFDGHWLFGRKDMLTLHHLGERVFCVPSGDIYDMRRKRV